MYSISPVLPPHSNPELSQSQPSSLQTPNTTPPPASHPELPNSSGVAINPATSSTACYGVGTELEGDVVGSSTPVEGEEIDEEIDEENPGNEENEKCFLLPYRQGGFFRPWLPHYFVLTSYSISMYPNEKRYERKKKEIILYDASIIVVLLNE